MLSVGESYEDDTELLLADLRQGMPVSLLAAPAVISHFDDYRHLFGYLQSLGVRSFHNVLLRADITVWAYLELLRRQQPAAFIASPCAAVSAYIRQRLPALLPFLIPVHSPLLCTMIYLRKYRRLNHRLAFLSPCVAKRAEMRLAGQPGYNVTIGRLKRHIAAAGIDLAAYPAVDFDDRQEGGGVTLGAYGGLCAAIVPHLPTGKFIRLSGPAVYPRLRQYEQSVRVGAELPTFAELYHCSGGCENGTGTGVRPPSAARTDALPAKSGVKPDRRGTECVFARFRQQLCLDDFRREQG